jgi:hypothetical protein
MGRSVGAALTAAEAGASPANRQRCRRRWPRAIAFSGQPALSAVSGR